MTSAGPIAASSLPSLGLATPLSSALLAGLLLRVRAR
jgi:hypothetical protein